ncbi:LamG-like jellyroll fold domain-containing protein [Sphingomonas sp. IW22]|uniref:LamG-like jellyroll fold domain-containing protein n=1 Tax=Sphingomonas sp. IW22 TaxID=3242489 RepID=UPI003522DA4A
MAAPVGPATAKTAQYPVFVTADIDPGAERDDEGAMALWLATQDHFNLVGFAASMPGGLSSGFTNQITAYEADRATLVTHTPYPERFKAEAELTALCVQGPRSLSPSKGYREPGDDDQYDRAHAAAQAMIAAAAAHGNPDSELPQDKLWISVQGSFDVVAQAAYEAVQLGQQPDFFRRVRIIGQPNFNTGPNGDTPSWVYLTSNSWPDAETPGLFGDMHLIAGYHQWHAFNRDNSGSDADFWVHRIVPAGAMGAFMQNERSTSNYPSSYYRAGDAGAWFWLISAKLQGNFDPANTANWCGKYRPYVGELWAARTFGYGTAVNPQFPNPEHTWWNPHAWAPELTITNTTTAAEAAVNLDRWYAAVAEAFERYRAPRSALVPSAHALDQFAPAAEPLEAELVDEWLIRETEGQYLLGTHGSVLALGLQVEADTADPTFIAEGVTIGTNDYLRLPEAPRLNGSNKRLMAFVVRVAATSGMQTIAARDDSNASSRQFQLRFNGGRLEYIRRYGGGTSATTFTDDAVLPANTWLMVSVYEDGPAIAAYVNGAEAISGTVAGAPNPGSGLTYIGSQRSSGSTSASLLGDIAHVAIFENLQPEDIAAAHQRVRDAVAVKGITV